MSDIDEALKPHLRKSVTWTCATLARDIPLQVYFGRYASGSQDAPIVVYVRNHGAARIGQEEDLPILRDYLDQGYIVLTADFGNDPRTISPDFDGDLHSLFLALYGKGDASPLDGVGLMPRPYRCFFLPAGYRIASDLVYWEIDRHAAYGTLNYVMFTYNESVAGKFLGKTPVTSPEEMTDPDGNPFDYKVRMDIIYPSHASRKVPLVYYLATSPMRMLCGSPRDYRPHLIGFLMRGYAVALIGHCYNPVVNHYEHIGRFTLDHWNGLACYTAAVRFIRAHADAYGIDARHIGGVGHSKGQYSVTRLSDPHNVGTAEQYRFKGYPGGSPEPQPYPGYPSHIFVGYQSMGMGLFRPQYVTPNYAPTLVACGENEQLIVRMVGHDNFVKRLEELDVNHLGIVMKGLGHELPHGYDEDLGVDRYRLLHAFFDRYLKAEERIPPVILLMTPCDGAENVSPWAPIAVHFAPMIDTRSVTEGGVRLVRRKDDAPVPGGWKVSHGGTRFTFVPDAELEEGEAYRLVVTTAVKDGRGIPLEQGQTSEFVLGYRKTFLR